MTEVSSPPIVQEEEGISFLYYNDSNDAAKSKPFYIGTKRFAGLYCRACERPLGFSDEKPIKMARAMRKADKNDTNIVSECPDCGAKVGDKKQIVVPCCSFDWHIQPHILERMLNAERAVAPPKKSGEKKEKGNKADDDNDSTSDEQPVDEETKAAQKRNYKENQLQIEAEKPKSARSSLVQPKLARKGHIENQYGHVISLEDFFSCIVEPCTVRCYNRIPSHYI